jgi:hypothetical protein
MHRLIRLLGCRHLPDYGRSTTCFPRLSLPPAPARPASLAAYCAGRPNGGTSDGRTLLLMQNFTSPREQQAPYRAIRRPAAGCSPRVLPVPAPCPRRKTVAVHDARRAASPVTPQHPSSGDTSSRSLKGRVECMPTLIHETTFTSPARTGLSLPACAGRPGCRTCRRPFPAALQRAKPPSRACCARLPAFPARRSRSSSRADGCASSC